MWISHHKQRGSALLTILWLTAALSAIGLAVANNVRGETERAQTNLDDAKAYFASRGAIERAALHILWGPQYRTEDGRPIYYTPGNPVMDLAFPEADVRVEIVPETSKLNLNGAHPEELYRLLLALGTPEDQASQLTSAIIDWRTPPDLTHPSPFDAFYLSQSPSFLARHASFQENEELLLVKGMTSDLYYGSALDNTRAGLRDCVSVYGTTGALDINTARPATLEAIGIAPEDAANIVKIRSQHPVLDGNEFTSIVQALGPAGGRLRIGGRSMFTLRASARMKRPDGSLSDMRRTAGALVRFTFPGNLERKTPGFEVLRWYDRT